MDERHSGVEARRRGGASTRAAGRDKERALDEARSPRPLHPAHDPAAQPPAQAPAARRAWGWRPTSRVALRVLGRAAVNFRDDRCTQMSAAISYYALFSLFPLTLLAVSIFGIVLRSPDVQDRVLNGIIAYLPVRDEDLAASLRHVAELGPTLTVVALFGSLWSAGAVSAALRSALNVVFDVHRGRPLLRAKLIDYMLLPIIGLPLLGGVVLTTAWRLAREEMAYRFGFLEQSSGPLWALGALAIPFVLSFAAFLLTYRVVPNRALRFRYLWPGALLAAVAFEALKAGFTFYLRHFANFDVVYGSLGSVIVLLFWIYLSANIFVFGAEVAAETPHVLHEEPRHGTRAEGNWRDATWSVLRGLVLAGEDPPEEADDSASVPAPASRADPPPDAASARRRWHSRWPR